MARQKNILPTVPITLAATPPMKKYLEELVRSGLYGKTEADAAERLVAKAIHELLRSGDLKKTR